MVLVAFDPLPAKEDKRSSGRSWYTTRTSHQQSISRQADLTCMFSQMAGDFLENGSTCLVSRPKTGQRGTTVRLARAL